MPSACKRETGSAVSEVSLMILYFSGTGNSLYVAKKLAELTGDTAVPISVIHERCQRIQDRIIGFVFPVYFGDLPEPVQDFIRQVRFQKSTYFMALLLAAVRLAGRSGRWTGSSSVNIVLCPTGLSCR